MPKGKILVKALVILSLGYATSLATLNVGWHEYYQENGVHVVEKGFPLPFTKVGYVNGVGYESHPTKYTSFGTQAREINALAYSALYGIGYVIVRRFTKKK